MKIGVFNQNNIKITIFGFRFLRGACVDNKCLLSHNLAPEKMPTCNYYLEGRCLKDDCPYLHVKVSAKADICKDFLVGYCKLAKEVVLHINVLMGYKPLL